MESAGREIYWNINADFVWIMYVLLGISVAIAAAGIALKIRSWAKGKAEPGFEKRWSRRLWDTAREILFQSKVRGRLLPGLFHSAFFWSFMALFVVTLFVFVEADFGLKIFHGWLYILLTVLADAAGAVALIGIIIAMVRRYVLKPSYLEQRRWDWALYLGIAYILVSGFVIEGLRIAVTGDPWARYSPVGLAFGYALRPLTPHAGIIHEALWWSHLGTVALLIATLPWSRLLHIFTQPASIFLKNLSFRGFVKRQDVEPLMEKDDFTYGLSNTSELTWKQRMDLDTCIGCGRCEEICPSALSGGSLSPRKFIATLKSVLRSANGTGRGFFASNGNGGNGGGNGGKKGGKGLEDIGLAKEMIWYCRTCFACAEVCPAMVEHVRFMLEIRQNKTMMEGDLPADASRALQSMQTRGNPWGPQIERTEWLKANNVRVLKPGEKTDVLYWLGCCTSYDQTKQRVAINTVRLLQKGGVDFAILGDEEVCCGDPARVLGDESIFQDTVKKQLEKIKAVSFDRIVTHCPHCYHVLKNEYKTFGIRFNVLHHSEILRDLLLSGRLKPRRPLDRTITFHDPCYLGRYQGIFDAPRKVLGSIPQARIVEMSHHRERSFCCGGGGGHYWMDLKNGKRLGDMRVDEATALGADTIAVGCVYCLQMMEDAVKNKNLDEKMRVLDIADILTEAME